MKTDKRTFVFYLDWTDILNGQPDNIRLAVFDAIIEYVKNGNEPEKGTPVYLAFQFIKYQIDKDTEKYAEVCDKRANAGRKHKGNQYTKRNKTEQTEQTEQVFQNGTNGTDNDYEYDNDYDNNTTINSSDIVCAEKSAPRKQKPIEERINDFMNEIAAVGKNVYPDKMLREFFDYWSETNANGKKMRKEMQKTFETKKRLATWANREKEFNFKSYNNGNYNNPNSTDYIPTDRIVAAGFAMAKAGM